MIVDKKQARLTSRFIRSAGDAIAMRKRREGNRLCILSYHRILASQDPILSSEPDVHSFTWQMELLAECFNVMPLYDAVQALTRKELPPRAVCITFDDGYRSIYEYALPVLKSFRLPATVFVTTGCMSAGNMWNDRIIEAVRKFHDGPVDLREFGIGEIALENDQDRNRLAHQLIETLKYLSPDSRLALSKKLEAMAGELSPRRLMLTPEMVACLSQEGVEIGGHTISHPILTRVNDDAADREIIESKRQLEAIIGKAVRLFAYPNGKPNTDFGLQHVEMVKNAGYLAAFTTAAGAATRQHDIYQLPRSRPWDASPFMYAARILSWLQG